MSTLATILIALLSGTTIFLGGLTIWLLLKLTKLSKMIASNADTMNLFDHR